MNLHTEFQAHAERDLPPVFFLQFSDFRFIAGVIHIGKRDFIRFSRTAPAPDNGFRTVPVRFNAIIHMVRKTDFIRPKRMASFTTSSMG